MVYGQGPILWEGIANISVILTDLFCLKTELYHDNAVIWYHIGTVGKIQLPYVIKSYGNTDTTIKCIGRSS